MNDIHDALGGSLPPNLPPCHNQLHWLFDCLRTAGLARLCRFVPHYHRETHGEAQHLGKESCHYRNHRLYVGLCSDKTGTLTLGKMSLKSVAFLDRSFLDIKFALANPSEPTPASLKSLVEVGRLCNGASFIGADDSAPLDERFIKDDATDTAILHFT